MPGVTGGWADEIGSLNTLIDDLVHRLRKSPARSAPWRKATSAKSMGLEEDGRPLEVNSSVSAKLVNKMIEQLSVFTSEVTRVAREVGTEGSWWAAQVKGV